MKSGALCAIVWFAGLWTVSPANALTVRVDSPGGAPRLLVNGEPVRARMFFGSPGSAPIRVGQDWKEVSFDFVASGSATSGTMHFRFGESPGDVFLNDIQVTDLDAKRDLIPRCDFDSGPDSFSRDWTFWPTGDKNTVGVIRVEPGAGREGSAGLRVTLSAPPSGKWPGFHIYHQPRLAITQGHHYHVSFWARSQPERVLTIGFYEPGPTFTRLGGPPDCFAPQIRMAAEAGINFVSFPIAMPWPKPGEEADWSKTEAQCETVLRANPRALLLPRVPMNPPPWWRQAHPGDVMQWEDGRRDCAVVASPRYRHDAAERLAALVTRLEEKFGEHVAGYHPAGQNTGEWFYLDTWKAPLNGYAPADLTAWRQWLKERYGTDAALRQDLGRSEVSLETVAAPTPAERHAAPAGVFRDPAREQHLIDWAQFQQEVMAGCVRELAHAVRTASGGRKLVVFFYGYVFEFSAVNNGPAVSGHYALRRILDCPDIDVLCSPISYFDRGLGQSAPSMTAAESVALAGKLWLNEDDTRTYLGTGDFPGWKEAVDTLEDTNKELARNVAQEATRNFGTWWMDLGATGWFNDPGMWALMARLRAIDEPLLKNPTPFRPEVAAVIDERVMLRVAAGGTLVTRPGIRDARAALGRMGAPYGQYLLDDVLAGRVKAKLYVFLNAWSLSAEERAKLLEVTRGAGRVWCYAPGCFDERGAPSQSTRNPTAWDLKAVSPAKALAAPTEAGRKLGLRQPFGVEKPVKPLFAAVDVKPEEILATYPDGSAAVALRRGGKGTSLLVGAPGLTSDLLRLAAREAGVRLFTDVDCIVCANGPFLALHASQDGPVAINTGKAGPVADVLSGATIGRGPTLTLTLKRGDTRVLRLGEPSL